MVNLYGRSQNGMLQHTFGEVVIILSVQAHVRLVLVKMPVLLTQRRREENVRLFLHFFSFLVQKMLVEINNNCVLTVLVMGSGVGHLKFKLSNL